jgi:hypothetical protein
MRHRSMMGVALFESLWSCGLGMMVDLIKVLHICTKTTMLGPVISKTVAVLRGRERRANEPSMEWNVLFCGLESQSGKANLILPGLDFKLPDVPSCTSLN